MKIAKNATELIGKTPLLQLSSYSNIHHIQSTLLAKLEYFNPAGSVKDRIAYAMIKDAEEKGYINKDTVIIEPTSGNTGIGLAFVAAALGYKIIITLPESFSIERRKILKALGVELVLTPAANGMNGAIEKAQELAGKIPNSYIPQQFNNPANPIIHSLTTAQEIWNDTDGKVDIIIAGVGTGGTISGIGKELKLKNPSIQIIAVEPYHSPVLSGGEKGTHQIQGIGPGFIPNNFNRDVVDEIILVKNDEAIKTAQTLAKSEGILVGFSSGAALFAATKVSLRNENKNKMIVVILPDSGERYLSTSLFD